MGQTVLRRIGNVEAQFGSNAIAHSGVGWRASQIPGKDPTEVIERSKTARWEPLTRRERPEALSEPGLNGEIT